MKEEDLFAAAKEKIFGVPPVCKESLIGYNVAVNYFNGLVEEAESVLQKLSAPRQSLSIYLQNAFEFSSYHAFRKFPEAAQKIIAQTTENFRKRYEPLLKQMESLKSTSPASATDHHPSYKACRA